MKRADVYIRWEPGCEPPESLAGYLSGFSLAQWSHIMGATTLADIDDLPEPRPPELEVWWNRVHQVAAVDAK
jgi:hypothetical protein